MGSKRKFCANGVFDAAAATAPTAARSVREAKLIAAYSTAVPPGDERIGAFKAALESLGDSESPDEISSAITAACGDVPPAALARLTAGYSPARETDKASTRNLWSGSWATRTVTQLSEFTGDRHFYADMLALIAG